LRVPIATKEPELSKDAMVSSGTPVGAAVAAPALDLVQVGAEPAPTQEPPAGRRKKGDGPQS
jgi:hypothetical protein